ncbi:vasopressin V1a receptor-like [Centruroides sculpturatus]|uniref:vasopressin V1a receptor-like n=1 Tax=Centruroides sculpturatus TaxID=218467 RepID=UPI000C6DCBAB|nr:vasopressin V1a receptor-like [Centruroides sculpturatus]
MYLNYSISNESYKSSSSERDETLALAEIITLFFIFIFNVIGNCLVLLALTSSRIQMTRMYYFLFHLCVSDLVTAFLHVLPQIAWDITYRFRGGNFLCKFVKYFQILGPYLSSYVLVVTAIDRYQAICYPLASFSWTPKRSKIMILSAWITSLLCCVPQLFIFSYQEMDTLTGTKDCWGTFIQPWGEKAYVTWYAISVFFIPLMVIIFTYVRICKIICDNLYKHKIPIKEVSNEKNSSNITGIKKKELITHEGSFLPRSNSLRKLSRAKIKTIKITVVVIICYIACSCPFIIVQLWAYWYPFAQESDIWKGPTVTILMLLASLNSSTNPWIYLSFNRNLIQSLNRICSSNWRKIIIRQTTETNNTTHTIDENVCSRSALSKNYNRSKENEVMENVEI